jgi:hypothetical protein
MMPDAAPTRIRLSGPGLTPEMVERFSLLIPGQISDIDWAVHGAQVTLTCPDGLPPEIVPAMTDIALARGWTLDVFADGQSAQIL